MINLSIKQELLATYQSYKSLCYYLGLLATALVVMVGFNSESWAYASELKDMAEKGDSAALDIIRLVFCAVFAFAGGKSIHSGNIMHGLIAILAVFGTYLGIDWVKAKHTLSI